MVPWDGRKLANLRPGGRETFEKRREKLSAGTEKSDRQWEHVKGAVPKQWVTNKNWQDQEEGILAYSTKVAGDGRSLESVP